jgi:hypothetical protein
VADRPTDAGLQDDRRLPPRQRAGDPRGLRAVCRAVPSVQPFHADYCCDRREQVKAVNNRDKNFTVAKVAKRIEQVEASIARYLAVLDRADREDGDMAEAKTIRLKEKIEGRCQGKGGSSTCSATAISRAAIYATRARHSAKAAERLCL